MGSFLNFLSPALTVATQAAGARNQGRADARKAQEAQTLKLIELARQKALDEQNRAMADAQIANFKSLAEERLRPAPDKWTGTVDVGDKRFLRSEQGNTRELGPIPVEKPPAPRKQLVQIPHPDGRVTFRWVSEGETVEGARPQSAAAGKLSAANQEKLVQNEVLAEKIREASTKLKGLMQRGKNVTGPLVGRMPFGDTSKAYDPETQSVRRLINSILNTELYRQSGKAVTVQEYARAIGALPSTKADEAITLEALDNLLRQLQGETRALRTIGGVGGTELNPSDELPFGGVELLPRPE